MRAAPSMSTPSAKRSSAVLLQRRALRGARFTETELEEGYSRSTKWPTVLLGRACCEDGVDDELQLGEHCCAE